jgi:hypothetical protein
MYLNGIRKAINKGAYEESSFLFDFSGGFVFIILVQLDNRGVK